MKRNSNRRFSYKKTNKRPQRVSDFVMKEKTLLIDKNETKKVVKMPLVVSVSNFANKAGLPVTRVITELMKNGVLATINQTIDFDTASIIGDDLNLKVELQIDSENKATSDKKESAVVNKNDLKMRPAVVTVMGHVDHGKTSLLDKIRSTDVAAGESGGITQHISAYQVTLKDTKNKEIKNRTLTFIDTPGHAAFSAMREHGTVITDIVVLIVAADDGVMPQTIEVIEQAKKYSVPVIVAINKTDLPNADVMKTKQQLAEYELSPEEWGGKTVMVEVSAKTGKGISDLLEMILLQADMMELKANPKEKAVGVVIEAKMNKGTGATAIILIENGTLRKGDPVAIGSSFGKIRIMEDYDNKEIIEAGPSFPVRIAGLRSLPNFGNRLVAFDNEKEARETSYKSEKLNSHLGVATAKKSYKGEEKDDTAELNLIIKCDVNGSIEAVRESVKEIETKEAKINIISEGVGAISESEVTLAKATKALVVGFRVKELGAAKKIAEKEQVNVKLFDVIYELIDYVKEELADKLPPEIIEEELATGKVLAIFRDDKKSFVAGGQVESGTISVGDEIKIFQDNNEKFRAKVLSLRKGKNEAKSCESGSECGFGLPPHANVAVGDKFVVFKTIQKKRKL